MNNITKTITLMSLIVASLVSCSINASTQAILRLRAFAANTYGFKSEYPIFTTPGLMKQTQSPAHYWHQIEKATLTTTSKGIIFDQEYLDELAQKNDFETLTAFTIHEHTHLAEDHAIQLLSAQNNLEKQKNITTSLANMNPENTPDSILRLNRTLEKRADAGLKRFPALCLNQYHYYMKNGDREYKELQQDWLHANDPHIRATIAQVLTIFTSNNPKLIETIENSTHPNPYRRALYFKAWAQEGGLKTI